MLLFHSTANGVKQPFRRGKSAVYAWVESSITTTEFKARIQKYT